MVILKSKKEELHRFFSLEANIKSQDTFFMAYDWTTRPGKISSVWTESPTYLLENTMAANHGLFGEDVAFWLYIDTCQVNANLIIYYALMPTSQ